MRCRWDGANHFLRIGHGQQVSTLATAVGVKTCLRFRVPESKSRTAPWSNHNLHLPCCQCTDSWSHASPIRYICTPVPGLSSLVIFPAHWPFQRWLHWPSVDLIFFTLHATEAYLDLISNLKHPIALSTLPVSSHNLEIEKEVLTGPWLSKKGIRQYDSCCTGQFRQREYRCRTPRTSGGVVPIRRHDYSPDYGE